MASPYDTRVLSTCSADSPAPGQATDFSVAGQQILAASTLIRDVGAYLGSAGAVQPEGMPPRRPDAQSPGLSEGDNDAGQALDRAFGQAAAVIRVDFGDLGGSVKNIFRDIGSSVVQSVLSNVSSSPGALGGSAGGVFSSLFGAAVPTAGFGGGGRVQADTPVVVGERGAEIIVPTRPSVKRGRPSEKTHAVVNRFALAPGKDHARMIEEAVPMIAKSIEDGLGQMQKG